MGFDDVARAVAGVPFMSPEQGRLVYDHVRATRPAEVLELGTAHGVGAAYLAAALEDNGAGRLTTVDFAAAAYDPPPEALLARAGVAGRVRIVREFSSYTWWLKEQVQARSDRAGNVEPLYDFVYLDGAKNWTIDGLAVVLVEKLLRPGGWLLMDDLDWSYAQDPGREATDGIVHRELSEPERTQPHLRAVFDLIVAQHPSFTERAGPGRVVGLGAQGARRAAALLGRDEPPARGAGGRRRCAASSGGRSSAFAADQQPVAEVELVELEQVGVALGPRAGADVVREPGQPRGELARRALGQDRDAGAHHGIEVGLWTAPVGPVEAVAAVGGDRDRRRRAAARSAPAWSARLGKCATSSSISCGK